MELVQQLKVNRDLNKKHFPFLIALFSFLSLYSCSVASSELELQGLLNKKRFHSIIITGEINLCGRTLQIPKGNTLLFRGGTINNGHIWFHSNRLKGEIKFIDCTYSGSIISKMIDDRWFSSSDDSGTLRFLLLNAIENGAKCYLNRDYRIDMKAAPGSGFISIRNLESGAEFFFNGHTIYNTTAFPSPTIKPFLTFIDVKKVTIQDCFFRDVDEHNTHHFKNSSGCTFLQCYGDCESINLLNCCQENGDTVLRSGVYTHLKSFPFYTPSRGLSHSQIIVKSINTGYGLALYCGEYLDIEMETTYPRRGFYCAGVSHSRIHYNGHDPKETNCHILIKDAVYQKQSRNGEVVLDMKGCHDLIIKAKIDELNREENVIVFQSYGSGKSEGADFTFRSGRCRHYNIDFSADIKKFPDNASFLICNCASDSGALGKSDMYGCQLANILIHNVSFTGMAKKYMCLVAPFNDVDITIRDCNVLDDIHGKRSGYNLQINGNATGRIKVENGIVDNVIVKEKESGHFDIELENATVLRTPIFSDVQKSKMALVRILK